jgi:hypothetical protein
MICPFEILHFVPVILIAASIFAAKKLGSMFYVSLIILSVFGLVAGSHSHAEHGAFFGAFDPCWAYNVALAYGALNVSLSALRKFAQ